VKKGEIIHVALKVKYRNVNKFINGEHKRKGTLVRPRLR